MHTIKYFKLKTYLFVLILTIGIPSIGLAVILYFYPASNLLLGLMWLLGAYGFWNGFLLPIPKLWGSNYREWLHLDTLKVLGAFEQSTKRTLLGITDQLPIIDQHIERKETKEALALLANGIHVLITGESGSGKSGIASSIAKVAVRQGSPVLFLDARQYSNSINNLSDLGRFVNVEESLITCIRKVVHQVGTCLLIIDQLDSIVEAPAYQISIELLANASLDKNAKVVAVGAVSKKPEFESINSLKFTEVISRPIDQKLTKQFLYDAGLSNPTEVVLKITENLFFLSIILELISIGSSVEYDDEIGLLDKYIERLEEAEGGAFVQTAMEIAYIKLVDGQINFPLSRSMDATTKRLIQRGLLVSLERSQYRFRHEKLHFFLFAKHAVEQHKITFEDFISNLKIQKVDTPLVFVLKYLHSYHNPLLKDFLNSTFNNSTILRFYDKAALLDEMVTWQDVQDVQKYLSGLFIIIREPPYANYFFLHLANIGNSAWFNPLRSQGFFTTSSLSTDVEAGLTGYQWPALIYLIKMVPEFPLDAIEIARNIQIYENDFRLSGLIGSFKKISAEFAPELSPIVLDWLSRGSPVSEETIALIVYWITNGQGMPALNLVRFMLTPQETPVSQDLRQSPYYSPTAKFRGFDYFIQESLRTISDLPSVPWAQFLTILEGSLIQVLQIEEGQQKYEHLSFWRPSIEPSSQNYGDSSKDLLLDTILKVLDKLSEQECTSIVDKYLTHQFAIFRRIGLHLVRIHKNLWSKYLVGLYIDPKYWEDINYYHEYWLFTHETFVKLESSQQEAFTERLLAQLENKQREDREYQSARHWVFRRLWAIKDYLPSTVTDLFANLQKEFKRPEPEDLFQFLSYSYGVHSGWVSPRTSAELAGIPLTEVLSELKKPFPSDRTSFDEPTRDGLAVELLAAIKANPSHFTSIALDIFSNDIFPLYVTNYIRGFSEAWKDNRDFNWEPIIELCDIVSRTSESPAQDGTPSDMESDFWYSTYASARKAIVDLLYAAVSNDEHAIPHRFLDSVCTILLRLSNDTNPSPEYEEKQVGEGNWRYLDLSLNVIRANALAALIQYALHRARIASKDENATGLLPHELLVEPQVIEKLNEKLDKKLDSSKAVHVNFGVYLPNLHYLDEEWLVSHLEDIFPRNVKMIVYWQVAWEGYMWQNNFFSSLYPHLRPYYSYAIENIAQIQQKEAATAGSNKRLAAHLAFLYVENLETFNAADSLIVRFFDLASDELRSDCVKAMTPALTSSSNDDLLANWKRLESFWLQRYGHIQNQSSYDDYKVELATYLLWVPHIPTSLEPYRQMIEISVDFAGDAYLMQFFGNLSKIANRYPALAIGLFERSLQRKDLTYSLMPGRDELRTILESAIDSGDLKARESAIRVINLYGERGYEDYRELLH